MKKGKTQIGINLGNKPNKFICSISPHGRHICLLEFVLVLKLKNNLENSRLRENALAANESSLRMWLN